mmetsp:Transcript_16890/g.58960  ORF Transcript_16890/g.58960 Transcript_16890/m.58960 type:complete len:229 (+) Transcript_16890:183-869(+)
MEQVVPHRLQKVALDRVLLRGHQSQEGRVALPRPAPYPISGHRKSCALREGQGQRCRGRPAAGRDVRRVEAAHLRASSVMWMFGVEPPVGPALLPVHRARARAQSFQAPGQDAHPRHLQALGQLASGGEDEERVLAVDEGSQVVRKRDVVSEMATSGITTSVAPRRFDTMGEDVPVCKSVVMLHDMMQVRVRLAPHIWKHLLHRLRLRRLALGVDAELHAKRHVVFHP